MINLWHHWRDQIYYTIALGIIGAGFVTYLIGICYFAPQQKLKVMDIVLSRMQSDPQEFESELFREKAPGQYISAREAYHHNQNLPKVQLTLETPVHPVNPQAGVRNRKIGELDRWDLEDQEKFKMGLSAWGLAYKWEAA